MLRLYLRRNTARYPPVAPCAILPSTMQGEGLAHPLAFLLCLALTVGVVWLWRRFMGQ
jgi:hypothetical protein